MALDMERPSSVHSPDQHSHSGGGFVGLPANHHHFRIAEDRRSSSPEEERGSSPVDTAPQPPNSHGGGLHRRHHGGPVPLPERAPTLKFSIEQILSPDFGKTNLKKRERSHSTTEAKVGHSKDTTPALLLQNENAPKLWAPLKRGAGDNSTPAPPQNENLVPKIPKLTGVPPLPPTENGASSGGPMSLPAWVYCSRFSDRPSSGPRNRRLKKKEKKSEEKRPRTAFSAGQLTRLKQEFNENRYLTERRRQDLARDLHLNESQIKIWFQNKRAKIKKASGTRSQLALQLMAQGLYNHSTIPLRDDEDDERPKSSSSS